MYLSKLEIHGFKSFAQKTAVKFDNGVTGIVGPNGCGKSNIVDAIRWVLGEQKTAVLRSDKMENVIFNGTKNRKPLGMSEVSLTIENTKNILPTEYTEVTITRRLFRSGDSEYLLNKVPCRLKDINDLFMDTGMGPDAYSVIELKMIEEILSESPQDRRRLFEEAAGVTKYKQKRKATFKKLETTELDLTRVQDIVVEIEKKVGSLERQAKKAAQAKALKDEMRAKDLTLAEWDYTQALNKITPLQADIVKNDDEKNALTAEINKLDAALQQKQVQLLDIEKTLADLQRQINSKTELITGIEKQMLSNDERKRSLSENILRYDVESETATQKLAQNEETKSGLDASLVQLTSDAETKRAEYEDKKSDLAAQENELREKRSELEQIKNEAFALLQKISSEKNASEQMERQIESTENLLQNAARRTQTLALQTAESEAAINAAVQELDAMRKNLAAAQELHVQKQHEKETLRIGIEHLKESSLAVRTKLEEQKSRRNFLNSILESYEGMPEGVKFLDKDEAKQFGLGSLADNLSVEDKYKLALEAALGEALSYYITPNVASATEAIGHLREKDKGKVTFIVLERVQQNFTQDLILTDREATPVIKLVSGNAQVMQVLKWLLRDVAVVETLDIARRIGSLAPNANVKFVTLDGEIYQHKGMVRGGSTKQNDALRLGKKNELDKIEETIATLESELKAIQTSLEEQQRMYTQLDLNIFIQQEKKWERSVVEVEKIISQRQFEVESYVRETERLAAESETNRQLRTSLEQRLAEIAPRLAELEAAHAKQNEEVQLATEGLRSYENDVRNFSELVQAKSLAMNEAQFQIQMAKSNLAAVENEIKNLEHQAERLAAETESAKNEIFRITGELETMRQNLLHHYNERDEFQKQAAEIEFTYSTAKGEANLTETSLRDARRRRENVSQILFELQTRTSQLQLKAENIAATIKAEYDHTLEVKSYPDEFVFVREETEAEVQRLREKIKNLGLVNELALEEYTQEKERYDFLVAQKNDLMEAEKSLRDTIIQINDTAQQQFSQTFEQIRQNFISIFKELFTAEDDANILIEEAEDPLEANIEITAKPKGKRPQSISLLSGGEKTLTAIALLFAIYLVKPSPFCILDEVDAPLDDANIDRFIKIIKKFSSDTQFIIVTHNKRTMEAARMLYGVTMEEEGISKLVSVRFDERKN
jgi:chromosome segregation protein